MKSYCKRCKKYAKNINPRLSNTSNSKTMILSKCAIYSNKNSRFIKKQEAKAILSNLGLRTPLSKVPLLGDILLLSTISLEYEKNEIVNTFLLAGDKFMPEMHLKQSGFTYSTCGPFTKNNKKNSKI